MVAGRHLDSRRSRVPPGAASGSVSPIELVSAAAARPWPRLRILVPTEPGLGRLSKTSIVVAGT